MKTTLKKKLLIGMVVLCSGSLVYSTIDFDFLSLCSLNEFEKQVTESRKQDNKDGAMNFISNIRTYLVRP